MFVFFLSNANGFIVDDDDDDDWALDKAFKVISLVEMPFEWILYATIKMVITIDYNVWCSLRIRFTWMH